MAKNNNAAEQYEPFVPADKVMPEFTTTAIIIGVLMAVVFGGANAYLGLRVGMTISASIPAAVISMGIIRGLLKKDSILENNLVQTLGSAGESLAAGAVFTLPALYVWMDQWNMGSPSLFRITAIALVGGFLGVFFMVPLRKALIVNEHGVLPYPEGTACAEVLYAGEEGGEKAKATFTGLGIGALYQFFNSGLGIFPGTVETEIPGYDGAAIGGDVTPALLGVGYIIGPTISGYVLAGAVFAWLGLMPLIKHVGSLGEVIMYPSTVPIAEMGYWAIWDNYIRYIGAGGVAFGGIFSLIKSLPLIVRTFKDAMSDYSDRNVGGTAQKRTDTDISMKLVILGTLAIVLAMAMLPVIPVGVGGALMIAVFGFFFATVSSRIVGIVGSSSNPVSGMTIATLLITAMIFKASGNDGHTGMIGVLTIGAIVCIIAAMAGDTSQDLKTGFLVGATPKKQQYGEMIGVVASALSIGFILTLLHNAWGFGSSALPAPQATLMSLVIEGVMGGQLPWTLVFTGVGIGIGIELLGLPVLPITIGLYLPITLSTPIMVGGVVRGIINKKKEKAEDNDDKKLVEKLKEKTEKGVLYASGLIAGEGLLGIILAIFTVSGINLALGIDLGQVGALIAFGLLTFTLIRHSIWSK
jgi:putative OPT family oligopeptide transporter